MRVLKTALAIFAVVAALPLGMLIFFFMDGGIFGDCADEIRRTDHSPDSRYVLTVFIRDCGATTAFSTHVALSKKGGAETYSVLTKLPLRPRLDPATARAIVNRLIDGPFAVAELGKALYQAAVDRCVATESTSGAVYDAVHLLTAEANGVDALVTFNERHFRRLRPTVPLVVPPDPPRLSILD